MPKSVLGLGSPLFAMGMAALGFLGLLHQDGVSWLQPVTAGVSGTPSWGSLTGFMLIVSGVSLLSGWQARRGAGLLGVTLALWFVLRHLPALSLYPDNPEVVTAAGQTLGLWSAACVLWCTLPPAGRGLRQVGKPPVLATFGRVCFGLAMLMLGVSLQPLLIADRLLWPYLTAAAFLAAGLSIVTGAWGRQAAALLGIPAFGVVVGYRPPAVTSLAGQAEWTSMFTALALWGAALLIAASTQEAGMVAATRTTADWWPLARTSRMAGLGLRRTSGQR